MTSDPNPYSPPQSDLWTAGPTQAASVAFGDAPIATFRSTLNVPWFENAYDHWALAHGQRPKPTPSMLIFGVLVALSVYWMTSEAHLGTMRRIMLAASIGAVCSLLPLLGTLFNQWSGKSRATRQFRKSKDLGLTYTFVLYREGFVSSGPLIATARRWSGFLSSRRFPDGILIMLDGNQFHWLPWVDLVSGRADDVEALLRASMPDYKELRD